MQATEDTATIMTNATLKRVAYFLLVIIMDICENCKKEISECICMDGPEDHLEDRKRYGDYDYCGDDDMPPPEHRQ